MKSVIAIILLLVFYSSIVDAEEFFIEDPNLKMVPQNAVKTILQTEKDPEWKRCQFIGKTMNLNRIGGGKSQVLVVTTDQGCGCGNALCTIWVLQPEGNSYSVLLSDGGYSMTIRKQKGGKAPDIKFEASTAGWSQESLWKYDGKHYKRVKFKTK